jgi:hypothetical protein
MTTVFIVQALGFGDDEDAFENIAAFTQRSLADHYVADLQEQDDMDDMEFTYRIEEITLQA